MATVLLEDVERVNATSSYRSEANNVFRGLAHIQYLGLTPKEVAQWCDNEQVVKDSETPLDTPKKMLHADADMILAIHHLRNRADFHVTLRHVYGHQDTKSIEERKAKRKEKRAKRDTKRRILFASRAQLNESEARQALYQRVIPKLVYALHPTSWDTDQCDSMNRLLRETFLPLMRMNRNMPKAVVYGPLEYGGVAFPEVMSLQDETQLPYLLKELRWDKSVANAMHTTIDQLQMRVGFVRPIMEFTTLPIRYASTKGEFDGYFLSLRQRLADIDGSLWLEEAWTPT